MLKVWFKDADEARKWIEAYDINVVKMIVARRWIFGPYMCLVKYTEN